MAYYNICPTCDANLDPNERCTECQDNVNFSITDEMRERGLFKLQNSANRLNY